MDGVLLLVKGKTAHNLERTLNKPAPRLIISDEERSKVMSILKRIKRIRQKTEVTRGRTV